jgi:peptide/nickel transport system substrate-binding protein
MNKYLATGAALALTLAVAACGGGSGNDNTSAAGSPATSEPIGELSWSSLPIRRADVQTSFDHATASIVSPVVQGLVTYDVDGKVIPALASSVKQRDDVTYAYRLRDGITFSDGTPLTMKDVVWSLNRNFAKDANTSANYTNVKSVKAEGDEVVFKLKQPDVAFPNLPAFSGQIIQKAAAERGGVEKIGTPSNLPVGTGPYMFESFSPDTGAVLVANPHWYGEKPSVQKVTIKFLKDDSALALAMRSGDVDGAFFFNNPRLFKFPGVKLIEGPGASQMTLSLNTIVPPFDDVHVRKAIAYATDREGLLAAALGGSGKVAETLTPPSLYANIAPVDEVNAKFDALPRYDYDIEAAKAELAKSRYPDGFTTTFPADPESVKVAQGLAPDLAKIGIKLNIDEISTNDYLALLYGPRDKIGMLMGFYGATYPDPSGLMTWWLSPEQARVNGLNSANWKNAEVGRLLSEQSQAEDGAERLQLITEVFKYMKEEVPYVPLFAPDEYMVIGDDYTMAEYSPWLRSFTPWPTQVRKAA